MRIIRDYHCSTCNSTVERISDSEMPFELDTWLHYRTAPCPGTMRAVLSPVSTTFRHADDSPSKHRRSHS